MAYPYEHPEYYGKKQNSNLREVKVDNFPYMLVNEFLKRMQLIRIAAIYHCKSPALRSVPKDNYGGK